MTCITKSNIQKSLEHLFNVISGQRFLNQKGPANDVPFYICPFNVEITVDVQQLQHNLVNRLEQAGIRILEINLYDLVIELLRDRSIWEQIMSVEETVAKDQLAELLQGVLDTETHLVPAISAKLSYNEFDVLFLSGVGEVFPYIRSHNVLNNLQSTAKKRPTLIFFPGSYTHSLESGASLDLFSKLHDDKYYRAFNIFDCEA